MHNIRLEAVCSHRFVRKHVCSRVVVRNAYLFAIQIVMCACLFNCEQICIANNNTRTNMFANKLQRTNSLLPQYTRTI